jgi:hypothetical protein
MSIQLKHLKKNLAQDIMLPPNCFYIGGEFINLAKSQLYVELDNDQYKRWLWQQIKLKTVVYKQLVKIKSSIIMGNDVILACSCHCWTSCNGQIIKKAICYLIEQEKLSAQDVEPSSWEHYLSVFSTTDDKLHDFCYWLSSNNYHQEKLNFYHLWISFICQRQMA